MQCTWFLFSLNINKQWIYLQCVVTIYTKALAHMYNCPCVDLFLLDQCVINVVYVCLSCLKVIGQYATWRCAHSWMIFFFTASKSCLISLFFNFFWRSALTSQTLWKLWLIINHSLTDFSPLIWSVIILVIKQIGLPVHSCLILLDTCTCIDCRSNWTPLSLTEIVKLHVICRTCNLEQIFSCWLIIILWQVQSKNRKEIYYQVQAVPWEATNAAKNLHILAFKLDLQCT